MTVFGLSLGKTGRNTSLFAIALGIQLMICVFSPIPGVGSAVVGLLSFGLLSSQVWYLALVEWSFVVVKYMLPYYRFTVAFWGPYAVFWTVGFWIGILISVALFRLSIKFSAWVIKKKCPKYAQYLASFKGENIIERIR